LTIPTGDAKSIIDDRVRAIARRFNMPSALARTSAMSAISCSSALGSVRNFV
jgi:hypothetical protein